MKDFLIVYSSRTGNTEKVAKALYEAVPERCDLVNVTENPSTEGYKVIFAGYWMDKGGPDAAMSKYLLDMDDKNLVFFQTLGAEPKSKHGLAGFANAGKLVHPNCHILGALSIRGAIDPQLIAAMMKMPAGHVHAPSAESKARWAAASTHPDAADLAEAKTFMEEFVAFFDKFYK